jgi:glycosyltransferase involved in cell wall biosynthesis
LVVGQANRRYYEAFGVPTDRLYPCPHSIDVQRFSSDDTRWQQEASEWRTQLQIGPDQFVVLFAGKFEKKKRPVELMRAVEAAGRDDVVVVMVGGGELEPEIRALATGSPKRFRLLPFQNQSRMPAVYRLGDVFVLPSQCGESWGLAVNEAMACGRPVIVSDRVGCAEDVVAADCGRVFPWEDMAIAVDVINKMSHARNELPQMRTAAMERAALFDLDRTADSLLSAVSKLSGST